MYYVIAPTNNDLMHSRGPWKKHKYLSKVGDKYVYGKGTTIGKLNKLNSSYDKEYKRINKMTASDHKFVDSWYGKPIKNPKNKYVAEVARETEAARRQDHNIVDNNDKYYKSKLKEKTREKASKIIGNSAAVKKGKGLISKLAKLFKKKK